MIEVNQATFHSHCSVLGHLCDHTFDRKIWRYLLTSFLSSLFRFLGYATLREHNVGQKAECGCGQFNPAHTRNQKQKKCKENTKTNKRQCPVNPIQVQGPRQQSKRNQKAYRGKDLRSRRVLSLEWKVERVTDDESEGGDWEEVICVRWTRRRVNRMMFIHSFIRHFLLKNVDITE